MMRSRFQFLIIGLLVIGLWGVAGAQETGMEGKSIADVDTSFWKFLRATDRSQWGISVQDSISAYNDYFLPGYRIFVKMRKINSNKRLQADEKVEKLLPLAQETQSYFEEAARLNPFLPNLKRALTAVYSYLEQIYVAKKLDLKRYAILLKRLILEKDNSKKKAIYYNLAKLSFAHKEYKLTISNCNKAIDLIFENESSKLDTTTLFYSIFQRARAEYELNRGQEAANSFRHALMISPEKYKATISSYLRAIEWDDGNIEALKLSSQSQKLIKEKKYPEAAHLMNKILDIAVTLKVRRNIQYRLASLEFYQLDKKEEGINRIWVQKKILETLQDTSAALDSTRNIFLNRYADMCFRLASNLQKTNRMDAFAYFYEITTFENKFKPRAYYFLASLSSNNDSLALQFCQKAYEYWDQLTKKDKINLSKIFYSAYLSRGDFDKAVAWLKRYHELKNS